MKHPHKTRSTSKTKLTHVSQTESGLADAVKRDLMKTLGLVSVLFVLEFALFSATVDGIASTFLK